MMDSIFDDTYVRFDLWFRPYPRSMNDKTEECQPWDDPIWERLIEDWRSHIKWHYNGTPVLAGEDSFARFYALYKWGYDMYNIPKVCELACIDLETYEMCVCGFDGLLEYWKKTVYEIDHDLYKGFAKDFLKLRKGGKKVDSSD